MNKIISTSKPRVQSLPQLYTYIITVDCGLAPNPFGEYCTLAVCTPNHQGAAVKPGDWIAGFSPNASGYQFIYAMQVDECIHMNKYFHDPRFQNKKPNVHGSREQRCGDNFYHQKSSGEWIQEANPFHEGLLPTDTRRPFVFVGRNFWYLGRDRKNIPAEFLALCGGRGVRVNHPEGLASKFMSWVMENFEMGVHALPLDFEHTSCVEYEQTDDVSCHVPTCR